MKIEKIQFGNTVSHIFNLISVFIELGERHPQSEEAAAGFLRIDRLYGFCVRIDDLEEQKYTPDHGKNTEPDLSRFSFIEFNPLVPFMNIVWVLSQEDRVQKQRAPFHQVLQSGQSQLKHQVI